MLNRRCVVVVAIIFVASGNATFYELPESCSTKRERGAAVTCDENGLFAAKQCNITSGTCWCVSPNQGLKIPGKTSADAATLDCSDVTLCQRSFRQFDKWSHSQRPRCREEDGHFTPMQCVQMIGCYCVVPETANLIPGLQNLDIYINPWLRNTQRRNRFCQDSCPAKRESDAAVQCDSDGLFAAKQCDVTSGECWCVVPHSGRKIPGSSRADGDLLSCSGDDLTPCEKAYQKYANTNDENKYVKCREEDGHYEIEQCERYGYFCKCVVPETGNPIPGLSAQYSSWTPCRHSCPKKRQRDARVSCDENGWYSSKQCDPTSGACWCVVPQTGYEIPGTKTAQGTALNCSAVEKRCQKDYIEKHVYSYWNLDFEFMIHFETTHMCGDDGHYRSMICRTHCRCHVPETGMELPGHGTSVGCENLTPCQRMWREASLRLPPDGEQRFPALTMCDDDGNFDSVRCDFDNSTCWCVAPDTGEKVPGSPVVAFASWSDDEGDVRRRLSCAVPQCPGSKVFGWIPRHTCEKRCEDLDSRQSCRIQHPRGKCVCPPDAPFADGDSCLTRSQCLAKRKGSSDAK